MAVKKFKRAAYILRTCRADMTSHKGFVWPEKGLVEAPDWEPTNVCGHGLHGFLNGEGCGCLADFNPDAKWIVAEIEEGFIDLKGKVKFPRANVVHCGDRLTACEFLRSKGITGAIVGGTATAGDRGTAIAGYAGTATAGNAGTATAGIVGTATAGYAGTATAGYAGTATAGDCGTATAGDRGTAIAGYAGTATAGDCGTATAGYAGTAIAGDRGTATAGIVGTATAGYAGTAIAGDCGTATAGDYGTATAGNAGTAIAGDRGTAIADYPGTATAGDCGTLLIRFYDGHRYRIITGYVGEGGIKPNKPYRLEGVKLVLA